MRSSFCAPRMYTVHWWVLVSVAWGRACGCSVGEGQQMAPQRPCPVFVAWGTHVGCGSGDLGYARENNCVTYSTAYLRSQGCGLRSHSCVTACSRHGPWWALYGGHEGSIAPTLLWLHVRSNMSTYACYSSGFFANLGATLQIWRPLHSSPPRSNPCTPPIPLSPHCILYDGHTHSSIQMGDMVPDRAMPLHRPAARPWGQPCRTAGPHPPIPQPSALPAEVTAAVHPPQADVRVLQAHAPASKLTCTQQRGTDSLPPHLFP